MKKIILALSLILTAFNVYAVEINDEVIVDPSDGRDWEAHIVAKDNVWQKPACVASTTAEDGISTLEVVSFYNEKTESFGEPLVHVLTPFDVNFFEVTVTTDRSRGVSFSMLPIALPELASNEVEMIGARALFDDRETLVTALRQKNVVTAKYFDLEGETKSIQFSLKGSSKTLRSLFERCDLGFSDLSTFPEPVQELL